MTTKHKNYRLDEARNLLEQAQRDDDIFGKTARSISHWVDRYGDYRMAWHKGILFQLESWLECPLSLGLTLQRWLRPSVISWNTIGTCRLAVGSVILAYDGKLVLENFGVGEKR